MKSFISNIQNGHNPTTNNCKNTIVGSLLILFFILFLLPVDYFHIDWHFSLGSQKELAKIASSLSFGDSDDATRTSLEQKCDIFKGDWVPYLKGTYYTNESSCFIEDGENCMKFGRPDTDYMKWRWKPDGCDLPLFNAADFLELVRGKSMAFIGDSLARNHMQSLGCLLSSVAQPIVESNMSDKKIRRWVYKDYNFTIQLFTTTHLVQSRNVEVTLEPIDLYLDEPDEIWAKKIDDYDYLIISGGHWFSRPLTYHANDKVIGCHMCNTNNMTDMTRYYGYREALKCALRTIIDSHFKGSVILRTMSPLHFESAEREGRGNCIRKKPFKKQETVSDWYLDMFHMIQVEEFRQAGQEAKEKGVKLKLLDVTEVMSLRPDGHPNRYGHPPGKKIKGSDCLHWCLPGAIDTWSELLLEILKKENEESYAV